MAFNPNASNPGPSWSFPPIAPTPVANEDIDDDGSPKPPGQPAEEKKKLTIMVDGKEEEVPDLPDREKFEEWRSANNPTGLDYDELERRCPGTAFLQVYEHYVVGLKQPTGRLVEPIEQAINPDPVGLGVSIFDSPGLKARQSIFDIEDEDGLAALDKDEDVAMADDSRKTPEPERGRTEGSTRKGDQPMPDISAWTPQASKTEGSPTKHSKHTHWAPKRKRDIDSDGEDSHAGDTEEDEENDDDAEATPEDDADEDEEDNYEDDYLLDQLKGLPRNPTEPFNIWKAFMSQGDLLFALTSHLDCDTFLNLYCIDPDFKDTVDGNMRVMLVHNARTNFRWSLEYLRWPNYRRLCKEDPLGRPSLGNPEVTRIVPTFKWLKMLTHRTNVALRIIELLEKEGLSLPRTAPTVLIKIYDLLDHPSNAYRTRRMANRKYWSNEEVFVANMIMMRLDMRFNDPVEGGGGTLLRRALMYSKSLDTLLLVLLGLWPRNEDDFKIFWANTRENSQFADPTRTDPTPFGLPRSLFSALATENWGKGESNEFLLGPDELALREAFRRKMKLEDRIPDLMLSGFNDASGMPVPLLSHSRVMAVARRKQERNEPLTTDERETLRDLATVSLGHIRHQMQKAGPLLRKIRAMVAAGQPLDLAQAYFITEMKLILRDYNLSELHRKGPSDKTLSSHARNEAARLSLSAKLASQQNPGGLFSMLSGLTQGEMHVFVTEHLLPTTVGTQVSHSMGSSPAPLASLLPKEVKHALLQRPMAQTLAEIRTSRSLTPFEISFYRASEAMMKQRKGNENTPTERAFILDHALLQVKRRAQDAQKLENLTEAEQILALTHIIIPHFQDRTRRGELLSMEDLQRLREYSSRRKKLIKRHAEKSKWDPSKLTKEQRQKRIQEKVTYLNQKRESGKPLTTEEERWREWIAGIWTEKQRARGKLSQESESSTVQRLLPQPGRNLILPPPIPLPPLGDPMPAAAAQPVPAGPPSLLDQTLGAQDLALFLHSSVTGEDSSDDDDDDDDDENEDDEDENDNDDEDGDEDEGDDNVE